MTIPIRFGTWAVLALFAATPIIAYSLPVLNPDPFRPLKLDPTPLEASLGKGYAALNRNELVAAATEFSEAAKLDAKSPLPYMGLAEATVELGVSQAESGKVG